MLIALISLAAALFLVVVYFVVVRGSLGLVKRRLDEDPDLAKPIPADKLDADDLPVDVEY
jgi:hypothetical protein